MPRPIDWSTFRLDGEWFPRWPIRLLVVTANPWTRQALRTEAETAALLALARQPMQPPRLELTLRAAASLTDLQLALDESEYDIFHFAGHATRSDLVFEDERGAEQQVDAAELARWLSQRAYPNGSLRAVVANACYTCLFGDALRVPYVISWRGTPEDDLALEFSSSLYRWLIQGHSLESALEQIRANLAMRQSHTRAEIELRRPSLPTRRPLVELGPEPESVVPTDDSPARQPKLLHTLQREVFDYLDNLEVESIDDLAKLSSSERCAITRKMVRKLAAAGHEPEDLVELTHVNFSVAVHDLRRAPEVQRKLDVFERKTALHAQHTMLCIPGVRVTGPSYSAGQLPELDTHALALLFQHRELISAGRMSIIPETVRSLSTHNYAFDHRLLRPVHLQLGNPALRAHLLEDGEPLRRLGFLTIAKRHGGSLPLGELLAVEDKYNREYTRYQRHLRSLIEDATQHGSAAALVRALDQVEDGVEELEARYETAARRWAKSLALTAAGTLVLGLYAGPDAELVKMVLSALSGASATRLVSFFPTDAGIPDEIRHSPYFIPWYIKHKTRA